MLVAVGAASAILQASGVLGRIDWYAYKPTAWVIDDLGGPDVFRAVCELERRQAAGRLTPQQVSAWAEGALGDHSGAPGWAVTQLLDSLARLHRAKGLSADQRERFFSRMVNPRCRVRPLVRAGDLARYFVDCEGAVTNGFSMSMQVGPACLDGRQIGEVGDEERSTQSGGGTHQFWLKGSLGSSAPGRHAVHLTYAIRIWLSSAMEPETVDWVRDYSYSGEFEVLPPESPDPIVVVRSAALDEWARANVTLTDVGYLEPRSADQTQNLTMRVLAAGPPPTGLAFEVYLEHTPSRVRLGEVAFSPDPRACRNCLVYAAPPRDLDLRNFTVVLQPSLSAARATPDIFEIWGGALRFPRIRLQREDDGRWWENETPPRAEVASENEALRGEAGRSE